MDETARRVALSKDIESAARRLAERLAEDLGCLHDLETDGPGSDTLGGLLTVLDEALSAAGVDPQD